MFGVSMDDQLMKFDRVFLKGSILLLIGFGVYNFFNFVFQFVMARMLTISDYGVLATIFSMFYLLTVLIEGTQTVVAKFASTNKELGSLNSLARRAFKKSVVLAFVFFAVYAVISFFVLKPVLNIDYKLLLVSGIALLTSLTLPINRGILQGRKRFFALSLNLITESLAKMILGVILVVWGFAVYGAIVGTLLGAGIALIFSFIALRDVFRAERINVETKSLYHYSIPTFLITIVIIAFYSLDILIARALFSPEIAGMYAIASVLSKTVFWGTQPISRAMFPISSENDHANPGSKSHVLFSACLALSALVLAALVLFYFFSDQLVYLFAGKNIPESAGIVMYLVLSMGALSFTNLFLLYRLSINRVKGYLFTLIFLAIEVMLLFMFSNNITEYSIGFMISSFILLVGSMVILR